MNHKQKQNMVRGALALSQARTAQAAAPAGVYLTIVICCNREGSSIAAEGRKVTTTELIKLLESQARELRASIPEPPPVIFSRPPLNDAVTRIVRHPIVLEDD